ncbi:hypothetical protein Pd630_LPD06868 [Rhodococcus opacus PD630]|nr:hypothetical protein Pd630_LPD06868 [Rhodococcus opacus PD630]
MAPHRTTHLCHDDASTVMKVHGALTRRRRPVVGAPSQT